MQAVIASLQQINSSMPRPRKNIRREVQLIGSTCRDAFVIANTTFKQKGTLPPLELGAEKLELYGHLFKDLQFPVENVHFVSDVEGWSHLKDHLTTPTSFLIYLRTELEKCKGETVVMVFVTHGISLNGEQGLCFEDTRYNRMANKWMNVLPVSDLVETIRKSGVKNTLLILEACHGDFGFLETKQLSQPLESGEALKGLFVLTSTSHDEEGHEGSDFARIVEESMRGKGQVNEYGYVTATLLVDQVCELMPSPPSCRQYSMIGSEDFLLSSEPVAPYPSQIKRITKSDSGKWQVDAERLIHMIESSIKTSLDLGQSESIDDQNLISRAIFLLEIVKGEYEAMKRGTIHHVTPHRLLEYHSEWDRLNTEISSRVTAALRSGLEEVRQEMKASSIPSFDKRYIYFCFVSLLLGLIFASSFDFATDLIPSQSAIVLAPPTMPTEQTCINRGVQITELVSKLSKKDGSIVGIVGVQGMGGIGKTVLAYILYHSKEVRDQFSDGVYWITIGQDMNTASILRYQTKLYLALSGEKDSEFSNVAEAQSALESIITKKNCLIILDDVWNGQLCRRFGSNVSGNNSKILVTTRDSNLFGSKSKDLMYELNYLNREEATALIAAESNIEKQELEKNERELDDLIAQCGKNPIPLVVSVVGGMVGVKLKYSSSVQYSLKKVTKLIKQHGLADELLSHGDGNKTLSNVLLSSLNVLSSVPGYKSYNTNSLFLDLSVFPEDYEIPVSLIEWLWSMRGVPDEIGENLVHMMCSVSLMKHNIKYGKPIVKIHDSVRQFAQSAVVGVEHDKEKLKDLHRFLITSYESKGARNEIVDDYMLEHLTYHLNEADQYERIFELLTKLDWIYKRGISAVLYEDCRYLSEIEEYRDSISLLESALGLSINGLADNNDPGELAFQLYGRLQGINDKRLKEFAGKLKKESRLEWISGGGLKVAGDRLIRIFSHYGEVNSVIVTRDGEHLITVCEGIVRVWDIKTGECESVLKEDTYSSYSVAMSPDDKYICSGGYLDSTVRVNDFECRKYILMLKGHALWVNSVAFSPCGKYICSGSVDRTLRLWDMATGTCERIFEGRYAAVISVAFCPDGRHIVSGSADMTVRVWDVASGQCESVLEGHTDVVNSVAVSPDGKYVCSGSEDMTVRVFNLASRECERVLKHTASVKSVVITSDNKIISAAGSIKIWDLHSGHCESSFFAAETLSLALSPDGSYIFTGSGDNTARMFSLRKQGEDEVKTNQHSNCVTSVAISHDGKTIVTGSADKTARVWDTDTGACKMALEGHTALVVTVGFSDDDKSIFTGSMDKIIRVWNSTSGACKAVLKGHMPPLVRSIGMDKQGTVFHLRSGIWHNEVRDDLINGDIETFIEELPGFDLLEIDYNHQLVVYGSEFGEVRVHSLSDGKCKSVLKRNKKRVFSAAISSDGNTIITSSWEKKLRIWSIFTGQCLSVLEHTNEVLRVAFAPDGSIISESIHGELQVWSRETGQVAWSRRFDVFTSSIAVHGDKIVVGVGYGLAVLRLSSGESI